MSASPVVAPTIDYRHLLDQVHALHEGELAELRAQIRALEVERAHLVRTLNDRDVLSRSVDRNLDKAVGFLNANSFPACEQELGWAKNTVRQARGVGRLHGDNVVSLAARAGRS